MSPAFQRIQEFEILPGLLPFAKKEIEDAGVKTSSILHSGESLLIAGSKLKLKQILKLRTISSVFSVCYFDISRPKALLGNQNLNILIDRIQQICSKETFVSFRLNAAGKDSSVLKRLCEQIEKETKLEHDPDHGELLIKLRPSLIEKSGWDVALRLTPVPLSKRTWRVEDMPGALNGCIAAALIRLSNPQPEDSVLNMMCGSGTILIERALKDNCQSLTGIDLAPEALQKAQANIEAAELENIDLKEGDACQTFFPDDSFNVIFSDPPWGERVAEISELENLYTGLLKESLRLLTSDGRIVLITQRLGIVKEVIRIQSLPLKIEKKIKVFQKGFHPYIILMTKLPS